MTDTIVLERRLEQGKPLIDLLNQFPEAHSLHSPQASTVSRSRWNLHALKDLIYDVEAVISDRKTVLSNTARSLYELAKAVSERATRAESAGLNLSYAPALSKYQRVIDNFHS